MQTQANSKQLPCYRREEVYEHRAKEDCWIILHGEVYNVTSWLHKHPGGAQLLLNHAGEDASVAWTSFHNNKTKVSKYMTAYHIGSLIEEQRKHSKITEDFLEFRKDLENKGMFKASPLFVVGMAVQCVLLEAAAWWLLYRFGSTWPIWIVSGLLFAAGGTQLGWLQHDFLHGTVFNSIRVNRFFHDINLGLLQGVPINWWDGRHFLHHAKPNVIEKDPDITIPFNFFLLGKSIPKEWGEKHWGWWPYQLQHLYFFFTAPSFGITIFFQVEFILHALRYSLWKDILWMCSFYLRFYLMYSTFFGSLLQLICWYYFIRFIESQWYVWVTQINHLSMDIDPDQHLDWVSMQIKGTCNVAPSPFMDWFTGHLDYQIEHHLFPMMPRSSYKSIQSDVKDFCQKHGLAYEERGFLQGAYDILKSLKHSGKLWADAWNKQSSKME